MTARRRRAVPRLKTGCARALNAITWTPRRRMARAAIYFRKHDVIVHSRHRTTTGALIAGAPAFRIPREELATALVGAVREALRQSMDGVEHPTVWKEIGAAVLEAARVRTWAALERTSQLCHVDTCDDGLSIVPTRNGGTMGSDRGFHGLPDLEIRVPAAAVDGGLVQALLRAAELCEPW